MGVIKRGILGGFSGKVANVVGSSWKGIAVMKSLPLSVANPRTAAQVTQRTKFGQASKLGSKLLPITIVYLWDRFAQQASGFNDWVRTNIPFFDSNGDPVYDDLIMSQGSLEGAPISGVTAVGGSATGIVAWGDNSGNGNALATDEAIVTIINETQNEVYFGAFTATRSSAQISFNAPTNMVTDDVLHVYLSFRRPDGTIVSNSSYGTLEVA